MQGVSTTFENLNPELKQVYYVLVESVIGYGIIVWGSAAKIIISKFEVAQKWIIKVMLFKN